MKKKRVFVTGMSDHAGGVETYIKNLYNCLQRKEINFVYNEPNMIIDGKEWVRPSNRHNYFSYCLFWNRFFKENAFDAVYYNTCDIISIDILRFAKKANIPVRIIHSHCANDDWKLSPFKKFQEYHSKKVIDKYATTFFACSEEAGHWMFGDRNFIVIKNGINVEKYRFNSESRETFRKQMGIQERDYLFLSVGRLEKVKNLTFALDVMAKLAEEIDTWYYAIVGEGSQRQNLMEQAKRLGIEKHVVFLGLRNDVCDIMSAADCLLMPSLFEGLPFSLIEAQTSGLPCIVSDDISPDANITGIVSYCSLTSSLDKWVQLLLEACTIPRKDMSVDVLKSGYSIDQSAKIVEEYLGGAYDS